MTFGVRGLVTASARNGLTLESGDKSPHSKDLEQPKRDLRVSVGEPLRLFLRLVAMTLQATS
jgi:hypothetical protein